MVNYVCKRMWPGMGICACRADLARIQDGAVAFVVSKRLRSACVGMLLLLPESLVAAFGNES